jgi:hypothetical protein
MNRIVLAITLTLVTTAAHAGVLNDGYIMCLSEESLKQSFTLLQAKHYDMLKDIGCFPTSSTLDGVVVDRGILTSGVRIRIPSGGSAVVYVPSEAIAR